MSTELQERYKPNYGIFTRHRWLTLIETREEIELNTSCDCPPIPDRSMDWSAIDANTYDASLVDGEWEASGPSGYGETEQEAIEDLFDKILERA